MADIDKTITTLQYMINNARNNHLKTTTIFISTLSDCMMYLKKLKRIEQPGVLLFDDPGPIKMKVLYRCDPDKNTECRKRGCSGKSKIFRCRCTSNPDYAERDQNGEPIIAYIHFEDQPPLMVNGGTDW